MTALYSMQRGEGLVLENDRVIAHITPWDSRSVEDLHERESWGWFWVREDGLVVADNIGSVAEAQTFLGKGHAAERLFTLFLPLFDITLSEDCRGRVAAESEAIAEKYPDAIRTAEYRFHSAPFPDLGRLNAAVRIACDSGCHRVAGLLRNMLDRQDSISAVCNAWCAIPSFAFPAPEYADGLRHGLVEAGCFARLTEWICSNTDLKAFCDLEIANPVIQDISVSSTVFALWTEGLICYAPAQRGEEPTDVIEEFAIGPRRYMLNKDKAEAALQGKRVINGRPFKGFNLLPLKYVWAYDLYKQMSANHWEPEDIPMQRDTEQWRSDEISDVERWIIRMGIGYFSAAEGIVGDNVIHVVRELVTAPELKLVLGRHAHEENVHADSLLYMISSLGINPHECEAMFEQVDTIKKKNEFVTGISKALRRDLDLTLVENKQLLAKNIFVFGQCMEGTQFYGLFGMILSLFRQNKFTGIGQMFQYTLRDESNHIQVFRNLFMDLVEENPEIWTPAFQQELVDTMREAVRLEKDFIADCLPVNSVGLSIAEFSQYIDFIADRRLEDCGLPPQNFGMVNPLPWLSSLMDVKKEQNFFETSVSENQKGSLIEMGSDEDL